MFSLKNGNINVSVRNENFDKVKIFQRYKHIFKHIIKFQIIE